MSLFEGGGWQVPPSKFGISVHVQAGLDAAGDFSVKKEDQICLEQYRGTSHGLKMLYCMILALFGLCYDLVENIFQICQKCCTMMFVI